MALPLVHEWISSTTGCLKLLYEPEERYRCGIYGALHDGFFKIDEDDELSKCSVFIPRTVDVYKALKMMFYANSECFVRVLGWREPDEDLLVVMERLETNVYDHFTDNQFNMTNVDGSNFDGDFLKEDVCLILRSMILSYTVAMEKLRPVINEQGQTTFIVNGKVKWLLINQNLTATETNAALLSLFKTLLDDGMSSEQNSFYANVVQSKTYYHPFVLTGKERERFPMVLIDRLRYYFMNQNRSTWTNKMRNATTRDVQLAIFRHRFYRSDMLDFVDYLRNFAVHVDDQNTLMAYRNLSGDLLALVPPTSERNITMKRIFGHDYLLNLWNRTRDGDYMPFLNMML